MTQKLHPGEPYLSVALVQRLLAAQFPHWAALDVEPVDSTGTDHALYRLGPALVVRLPRIDWAREQVAKEQRWLPVLAPQLPLAIPAPVAQGQPGEGYPWHWSVYRWLEGQAASLPGLAEPPCFPEPLTAARQLAQFVTALQRCNTDGGPAADEHNSYRGVPLVERDPVVQAALAQLHGQIDVSRATAVWRAALQLPAWRGAPRWVHGDLQPGNLLVSGGQLCAVIDFGCLGVGDPAVDLIVAWNFLPSDARAAFRAALGVDDATWARGRGWALYTGLVALPYYQNSNPRLASLARHTLQVVLEDAGTDVALH